MVWSLGEKRSKGENGDFFREKYYPSKIGPIWVNFRKNLLGENLARITGWPPKGFKKPIAQGLNPLGELLDL